MAVKTGCRQCTCSQGPYQRQCGEQALSPREYNSINLNSIDIMRVDVGRRLGRGDDDQDQRVRKRQKESSITSTGREQHKFACMSIPKRSPANMESNTGQEFVLSGNVITRRITPAICQILKSRKNLTRGQSEEERWKNIYEALCPMVNDIVNPCKLPVYFQAYPRQRT